MEERLEKVLMYLLQNGQTGIRELAYNCGYNVKQNKSNHDCCVTLRTDIEKINKSNDNAYTIVWDKDYNYHIAKDKEEVEEFIKRKKLYPALKKLKSYWVSIGKIKEDGQMTFDDDMETFIINAFKEI